MRAPALVMLVAALAAAAVPAVEWPLRAQPSADAPQGTPGNIIAVPVPMPGEVFVPPPIVEIPEDKQGDMVKLGRNIFVDTQRYARRYTGNGLSCASCHLSEGRKADAAPLWAAWGMYPMLGATPDALLTFEERVQNCFRLSLNGLGPPLDSPEMLALTTYAQWLSLGAPARAELPGRGLARIAVVTADTTAAQGGGVYRQQCALCHGAEGQGTRRDDGPGYQFPPLWGPDSFSRGSGLDDVPTAAAYIKGNMPLGRAYSLSDAEAYAVARYLHEQPRPDDPRIGWIHKIQARFAGRAP